MEEIFFLTGAPESSYSPSPLFHTTTTTITDPVCEAFWYQYIQDKV